MNRLHAYKCTTCEVWSVNALLSAFIFGLICVYAELIYIVWRIFSLSFLLVHSPSHSHAPLSFSHRNPCITPFEVLWLRRNSPNCTYISTFSVIQNLMQNDEKHRIFASRTQLQLNISSFIIYSTLLLSYTNVGFAHFTSVCFDALWSMLLWFIWIENVGKKMFYISVQCVCIEILFVEMEWFLGIGITI